MLCDRNVFTENCLWSNVIWQLEGQIKGSIAFEEHWDRYTTPQAKDCDPTK